MKNRLCAACVAITATAVGAGVLLGAGSAAARPFGPVNCSVRPQGTQVVTTCVNDDDAGGMGYLHGACTNGRILWLSYGVAPDSTQTFTEDCGPGGSPIAWEAEAQSQWQAQALGWALWEQQEQLREQQQSQR
jgi:hypothetical protein